MLLCFTIVIKIIIPFPTLLCNWWNILYFIVIHNMYMYIISPFLATAELLYTSMLFNTLKIMYTRIYKLCVEIINIYLFI